MRYQLYAIIFKSVCSCACKVSDGTGSFRRNHRTAVLWHCKMDFCTLWVDSVGIREVVPVIYRTSGGTVYYWKAGHVADACILYGTCGHSVRAVSEIAISRSTACKRTVWKIAIYERC